MSGFRLPRLIDDGMVLQHGKEIHIWGWDEPGQNISAFFVEKEYTACTDEKGNWEFWIEALAPGGPYTMQISDEAGSKRVITDILIGDVFICSGQSNMDIPMARVRDRYPDEIVNCTNPKIRTFKIMEHGEFHAPLADHVSGQWWQAGPEHILDFSATAYFFAKHLQKMTGMPIGLIHASLGGSRIESWLSREMIEGESPYPEVESFGGDDKSKQEEADRFAKERQSWLNLMERYADDEFVAGQLRKNEEQSRQWHEELNRADAGLREHWEQKQLADDDWDRLVLPCMFRDTPLHGFIGSLWLRREFEVTEEHVRAGFTDREKMLWLGTLVDSDTVYVNGQQVGHTDYQYPPRKYPIPAGLMHPGTNQITIHLICEAGAGRVTPGKEYKIFDGIHTREEAARKEKNILSREIPLTGGWKYRIGASCGPVKETDFINWKPAALYNGMMAPNHPYTIKGIIWYQGESNAGDWRSYLDAMKRLIGGYRARWQEKDLPFYYVQLPNFVIDQPPKGGGWPEMRQQQFLARQIPHTGMAVAIDLGEDNDLHPLNKEDVGKRLALLAAADLYGKPVVCSGPEPERITVEKSAARGGCQVTVICKYAEGLYAYSADKGEEITDFELADEDGNCYGVKAEIVKDSVILHCGDVQKEPVEVRYCYHDTNSGALLYNSAGLPMSPFLQKL